MTMFELKTCPFCGGEAVLCEEHDPMLRNDLAFVKCSDCGCHTPTFIIIGEAAVKDVVDVWNRRPEITITLEKLTVDQLDEVVNHVTRKRRMI